MIAEIIARNRSTGEVRKIKERYPEKDMRNIEHLLQKVEPNEAVIEVRIDATPLL